jgi:glucuronosyltransferase
MLLNSHVTLTTPRPVITGMVQVGGLHIKKIPTLLPYDIKDFLDSARHGVIYFSLGMIDISKTKIFFIL